MSRSFVLSFAVAASLVAGLALLAGQEGTASGASGPVAVSGPAETGRIWGGTGGGQTVQASGTLTNELYAPLVVKGWSPTGEPETTPTATPVPGATATPTTVPTTTVASAELPGITLGLSDTAVVTGTAITLTWQVFGPVGQQDLLLRAREPGLVYTSTTTLMQPGMPPATGSLYYLRPDRTWTLSETAYLSPSLSGTVAVTLPSGLEGEWLLEALLRNTASGEVAAFDARPLLASSRPGLLLRLNRPIANTGDRVRAQLLTAAGQSPQAVKIAAWLSKAGGAQLSLPTLETGMSYAYEGVSSNGALTLLDRDLWELGPGDYRVEARAYYSGIGQLVSMAAAGLSVCDTPALVSGTVYAATGQPLGGGNPTFASVRAFDVDDGASTAATAIDAAGAYTLTLMPGRYLLSAAVLDSAGLHKAQDQTLLKTGCSGVSATRSLTATAPLTLSVSALGAAALPRQSGVKAQDTAGDALPKPAAFVGYTNKGIPQNIASQGFDSFFSILQGRTSSNVALSRRSDLAQTLAPIMQNQQMGAGDDTVNLNELARAVGDIRFTIGLKFEQSGSIKKVTVTVTKLIDDVSMDGSVIFREELEAPGSNDGWVLTAQALAYDLASPLYALLDGARAKPVKPRLTLSVSPAEVLVGGTVTATGTLKDADGTAGADKVVTLVSKSPSRQDTWPLTTDSSGVYQTWTTSGTGAPGLGSFEAYFANADGRKADPYPAYGGYRVIRPENLALTSPKVQLRTGETALACATLKSNGTPTAGAVVTLTASSGSLDQPAVTTDAGGRGCATYTAGGSSGIAEVTAQSGAPAGGNAPQAAAAPEPLSANLDFVVDGSVAVNLSAGLTTVQDSGFTYVRAEVLAGGARVPALPVQFSLSGNGTLNVNAAQTDADGQATVFYLAPASGNGTSVVSAAALLEGVSYTGSITLTYRTQTCQVSSTVPRCYDVVDIPSFYIGGAYYSWVPIHLSGNGDVYGENGSTPRKIVAWRNGTLSTLDTLGTLGGASQVYQVADVNDSGVVVGTIISGTGDYNTQAVKWQGGTPVPLGTADGTTWRSRAYAINNNGDVAGDDFIVLYAGTTNPRSADLWPSTASPDGNGVIRATSLGFAGTGSDINASGVIAGTYSTWFPGGGLCWCAFTWSGGQASVPMGGIKNPTVRQIGDSGNVVGYGKFETGDGSTHGFLWDGIAASPTDLLPLPGATASYAEGVNSSGQVVGTTGGGSRNPWLWENGTMYDLATLVDPADAGRVPQDAYTMGINNAGQILISTGWGGVVLRPR